MNIDYVPEFSVDLANGFYQVGYDLAKKIKGDTSYSGYSLLAPAVVNFSFATELYIKAIYMIQLNKRIQGHRLLKLYNDLPIEIKEFIEIEYQNNIKTLPKEITSYRYNLYRGRCKDNIPHIKKDYSTVPILLENHQDAFEKWRYIYEVSDQPVSFFEYDFYSMNSFIKGLKTYLKTISKNDHL